MKQFHFFLRLIPLFTLAALSTRAQSAGYEFRALAGRALLGSADGAGAVANFAGPRNVAVDGSGNVFVADTLNHTIRKITRAGVVSTLAGLVGVSGSADGAGSAARFNFPQGLAADAAGNLYVADPQNHTIRRVTSAGVVSTVAGLAGAMGATDGVGSAARFSSPLGVTVDRTGNLYVTDMGNNVVRKISVAGAVTTFAGQAGSGGHVDGTGCEARFNLPAGVAVDNTGNVFVTDLSYDTIRKITPAGAVTTFAGKLGSAGTDDGIGSAARFNVPIGLAADREGNVYVADSFSSTIRRITPAGAVETLAGHPVAPGYRDGIGDAARFDVPAGISVDGAGNVFVADPNNGAIRAVTAAGVVTTLAGGGSVGRDDGLSDGARFNNPSGVAVDLAGNAYVADKLNHAIRKISPAGLVTTLAGSAAGIELPLGVAVDRAGNVYVSNAGSAILKITPTGAVTTLAGVSGQFGDADGAGSSARFGIPNGLAVDAAGNIFVADQGNATIRKITPAGVVTTIAGVAGQRGSDDGAGRAARFTQPTGVALDSAGNIYVSDRGDFTVRKITPAGVVSTLAGQHGFAGATDGVGSEARFVFAGGIASDRAGNLFVAEGNNTVRQITPAGVVTTLIATTGTFERYNIRTRDGRPYFATNVATDFAGNLYVTDDGNNTVRRAVSKTRLSNLAVRSRTGTGDQVLTMGFAVTGGGAKQVLVRGVGPTLAPLGVLDFVADPQLKLFDGAGRLIQENDNWGGSARLSQVFNSVGAFPLEAGSMDAALEATVTSQANTAQVTAKDAAGGVALMEVYEVDANSATRLVNASVRTATGGALNRLIAGFVLAGTAPKTVLIRGVGPSLVKFGVAGSSVLADPKLSLFRDRTLAENDDWVGAPELKAAFKAVGAFDFDADTSKDAALLVTLEPGAYTVLVSGANTTSGIALIEVYELP